MIDSISDATLLRGAAAQDQSSQMIPENADFMLCRGMSDEHDLAGPFLKQRPLRLVPITATAHRTVLGFYSQTRTLDFMNG